MTRDFEVQHVRGEIHRLYDKRQPTPPGLYFRKSEVSDIKNELEQFNRNQ